MLIKLELEVTPKQLTGIGQLLSGQVPAAAAKPETPAAPEVEEIVIDTPAGTVTVTADEQTAQFDKLDSMVKPVTTESPLVIPPSPTSPAADAFAADVETVEASFESVELAKGTNGQMIPWDVRIHGKAKKKNADNSWRLIQGVDRDTLVPQVEAELVAALTAPKPVSDAIESSQEQTVVTPPKNANAANNVEPAASSVVPAPPTPAANKPATFAELLPLVTAAKAAGTLTDETIASTCVELGLAQFGLIATRPDLIPRAVELLGV